MDEMNDAQPSMMAQQPMMATGTPGAETPGPVTGDVLGLVVPGGVVRTDFRPADASGTKLALQLQSPGDLPSPLLRVNELVCFVLPTASIPPNHGVLIYWQLTAVETNQTSGFELLGALTPEQPSAIFRPGWGEHDQFISLGDRPASITFGVSIEPMESVKNLSAATTQATAAKRPMVAQKIAKDLFNFMQSFDTGAGGSSQMVVPTNIFDRWWKRFENKSQRDPNFFLKGDE